jgi:hypothetical protein
VYSALPTLVTGIATLTAKAAGAAAVVVKSPVDASRDTAEVLVTPVMPVMAALAGATDRTPAPNAATAKSAMRLKVVFVDIFFLSFSRFTEFP